MVTSQISVDSTYLLVIQLCLAKRLLYKSIICDCGQTFHVWKVYLHFYHV